MTSPIILFLFAWWLFIGIVVVLCTMVQPRALSYTWRLFAFATIGGLLANLIVIYFPSIPLEQAVKAAGEDQGTEVAIGFGWLVGKFLGPVFVPLIGWFLGMLLGLILATHSAKRAA